MRAPGHWERMARAATSAGSDAGQPSIQVQAKHPARSLRAMW